MYEFFCSALDRPWLLACELRDWLAHAGLPSDLRLTRPEWVAVRAALGRPRRLSLAFLHEVRHTVCRQHAEQPSSLLATAWSPHWQGIPAPFWWQRTGLKCLCMRP